MGSALRERPLFLFQIMILQGLAIAPEKVGTRTLIIDARYYARNLSEQYGKYSLQKGILQLEYI